jgi:2-polyprenyl-6-methoxyphenol hydroxylase-like FAD-dependent oxidoreductase
MKLLIIGGGIGGLATALSLHRVGIGGPEGLIDLVEAHAPEGFADIADRAHAISFLSPQNRSLRVGAIGAPTHASRRMPSFVFHL